MLSLELILFFWEAGINFIDTYELIFVFFLVFFNRSSPYSFYCLLFMFGQMFVVTRHEFYAFGHFAIFFGYIFKVCVHMNLSSKMGPSLLLLLLLLLLNIKMDPCELWLKSPENLCLILSVVLFFFLMKNTTLEIWQFVLGFY